MPSGKLEIVGYTDEKEVKRGLSGIDNAAAGTLGPNATPSVVVGFNGDGGIRRLSAEGNELWKQSDGNVWHVEIVADDKSGNVILHSNAKGQLTMRDANGNVLGRYDPEIYLASFAMTTWGDDPDRKKLVASEKGSIYVLSTDGKTVARLPAPGSVQGPMLADPKGTRVRFSARAPYFIFCGPAHCCTSMTAETSWSTMKSLTITATRCMPRPTRTESKTYS
jgi:hypothetical protein